MIREREIPENAKSPRMRNPRECGALGMRSPGNAEPWECGALGMRSPGNAEPWECGALQRGEPLKSGAPGAPAACRLMKTNESTK